MLGVIGAWLSDEQSPWSPDELAEARQTQAQQRRAARPAVRPGGHDPQGLGRDRGPLALAAGQLADRDERTAGQLKGPQHHVDRGAWRAAQRRRVAERARERQCEVNDVVLGDVADAPRGQAYRPRGGRPQAAHRVEQRGLARSAGADDRDQLPAADGQRHVRQRHRSGPGPLRKRAHFDRRLHGPILPCLPARRTGELTA